MKRVASYPNEWYFDKNKEIPIMFIGDKINIQVTVDNTGQVIKIMVTDVVNRKRYIATKGSAIKFTTEVLSIDRSGRHAYGLAPIKSCRIWPNERRDMIELIQLATRYAKNPFPADIDPYWQQTMKIVQPPRKTS
jgi:hypothetical protein